MTGFGVDPIVHPDEVVLRVSGEVDLNTAGELQSAGEQAIQMYERRRLVVDLAGVGFMDSTGLGALVSLRNLIGEQGGTIALANVPAEVAKLLKITALDQALPSIDSLNGMSDGA